MTQILTKDEQHKDNFMKMLKGKQVPRDMFGTIITIGDVICYGTGSQSASGLNFGRVEKINYNGTDSKTGEEKLTSITITRIFQEYRSWQKQHQANVGKWVLSDRKQAIQHFSNAWVVKVAPSVIENALVTNIVAEAD